MGSFSITNWIVHRHNNPIFGIESTFRGTEEAHEKGMLKRNALKVLGAIPFIGGIPAGTMHIVMGNRICKKAENTEAKVKGIGFIILGSAEIAGLGPFLFLIHLIKTVFDHTILPLVKYMCRLIEKKINNESLTINDAPGFVKTIVDWQGKVIQLFEETKAYAPGK